jgi:hypothetical protein
LRAKLETEVKACIFLEKKHIFIFPFSTWQADGWILIPNQEETAGKSKHTASG